MTERKAPRRVHVVTGYPVFEVKPRTARTASGKDPVARSPNVRAFQKQAPGGARYFEVIGHGKAIVEVAWCGLIAMAGGKDGSAYMYEADSERLACQRGARLLTVSQTPGTIDKVGDADRLAIMLIIPWHREPVTPKQKPKAKRGPAADRATGFASTFMAAMRG